MSVRCRFAPARCRSDDDKEITTYEELAEYRNKQIAVRHVCAPLCVCVCVCSHRGLCVCVCACAVTVVCVCACVCA